MNPPNLSERYLFRLIAADHRMEADLGESSSDWVRLLEAGAALPEGEEPEQTRELRDGVTVHVGSLETALRYDEAVAMLERETFEKFPMLYRVLVDDVVAPDLPPFEERYGRPREAVEADGFRLDDAAWQTGQWYFDNPGLECEVDLDDLDQARSSDRPPQALGLHGAAVSAEVGALSSLRVLTISEAGGSVPPEIGYLANLVFLEIRESGLTRLPASIGLLRELRGLSLKENQLRRLPDSLSALVRLLELDLSSNAFQELPDWIGELRQLRRLTVNHNEGLRRLPATMGRLQQLEHINLGVCYALDVRAALEALAPCAALRVLSLDHTWLPDEPFTIPAAVRELEWGGAFGNRYEERPFSPSIFSNSSLESLTLSAFLTDVPPAIASLTALRSLDLSHNKLTSLPSEVGRMTSLRRIRLDSNDMMTRLPSILLEMPWLEEIGLPTSPIDDRGMAELPDDLDRIEGLQVLELAHSTIESLPAAVARLRNLRVLSVCNSPIGEIPGLSEMQGLESLDVKDSKVDPALVIGLALSGMPNLKTLRVRMDDGTRARFKRERPELDTGW